MGSTPIRPILFHGKRARMSKKLEVLLEKYQGNCYPAMLEDLGNHLGVSAASLRKLALGFAPIVPFKKGPSSIGWWVIAERNAIGVTTGLSLRSQTDYKVMFPGSKHGLVYEVNPNHEHGGQGYDAGASNWIRTMDAGINCPVCSKPDGCLLSSENPSDPKAVVCIRVREGSEKRLRFGHLHIRKAAGKLTKNVSALGGDPSEYVLVVEGMSDTAAAMDLGFAAVGRPSNLACMEELKDLVRGRRVLVIGENDKKPDGTEPGKEGMIAAFQVLTKVCGDIKMVMPPVHVKDLRAWVVKFDLTREELLEYVAKEGQAKAAAIVIADNRPLTIARAYLDDQHRMAGRYLIKRWANTWYRYGGARYAEVSNEALEGPIYPWSHDKLVQVVNAKTGAESLTPLRADTALIANLTAAIMAETLVSGHQVPCWINKGIGPDPQDLIVFANGILHVPSFLAGKPESEYLLELTPDFFNTASLPFPFDPTAECPNWYRFLRTSLGDEQEKIMLLREWFGYCLTPDTTQQKLMYLRGPSGAGKSVVLNVLCKLVGEDQSASTSFSDLTGQFGLQAMIGKLVCIIPDARSPRGNNHMRGLELLLNITSGDGVQINRKFKDPIERLRLVTRISIASNEFLNVPDTAGAMLRRLNIIEFKKSFVGCEDFDLERKLTPEVPGIALWALKGLQRLREQGRFTVPPSSVVAAGEWRTRTNALASFVEECCDMAEGETTKNELYDAWDKWAFERHLTPIMKTEFYERMRSTAPFAVSDTYEKGGNKISVFKGIVMKQWAAKKYLGKP